jgi:hypothetical protein
VKHKELIADLERRLFPHQESEEEQEAFTPQGRQRVAAWLDSFVLTLPERDHVLTVLSQAEERGDYLGNRQQYWARHKRVVGKLSFLGTLSEDRSDRQ